MTDPQSSSLKRQPRSRGWVWYFAALVTLTVISVAIQTVYNSRQQLTQEQLDAAWTKWKKNGPKDYDFRYATRRADGTDSFEVSVRGGKATMVRLNGQLLDESKWRYSEMPSLFGFIDTFLREDQEKAKKGGPRTFVTASFDSENGHLQRYVRSVSSTRERVEIAVSEFDAR